MLKYHLQSRHKFRSAAYFATSEGGSIRRSNDIFVAPKTLRVDIRLQITRTSNSNNFLIAVVAECYLENLNVSMGFGGAHSLNVLHGNSERSVILN